ncbi:MAG TPA: PQQ-binding-like beta-propeller repeat protein [Vicinamibacterales bacterium]|nr:PQQ-binding-like beta-propeller repeat protein [Vicinamibacterales bacterium]
MRIVRIGVVLLLLSSVTTGAVDFLTEGVDNGRTGWVRDEKIFTPGNVGSTKLQWKLKLESTPRAMHNLFAPLVAERVTTAQGTRELAVVAGVSDDLFGIDVATGRQIWHRHFDSTLANPGGTNDTLCPGGQTAVPTLAETSPGKYTVYAVSWDGRLRQINLADGQDVVPAEKFLPGGGKPYALNLHNGVIYTATAQGCGGLTNAFYSYDLASRRASAFIPAGGGLWGRRGASIASDGTVYLGTGDAMFDPVNKRLGNGIVGVKLDEKKQLQLADYFAAPNANWLWRRDLDVNTTPVAFDYRNRKFLVGTSKECRLWLLDREALGGEDHRSSLHTTPLICNDAQAFDARGVWGALSAWQDEKNAQWVLVPFWGPVSTQFKAPIEHARPKGGGVAAFKLEERAGKWQLTAAWLSRDMDLAEEAVIANGVVFAYAAGEDATQVMPDRGWNEPGGSVYGGGLSSGPARRIPTSRRAALYALDAQTGKELWSSGTQIESWNHFSGLTVANGRAYIATFDGTLYCFGVAK